MGCSHLHTSSISSNILWIVILNNWLVFESLETAGKDKWCTFVRLRVSSAHADQAVGRYCAVFRLVRQSQGRLSCQVSVSRSGVLAPLSHAVQSKGNAHQVLSSHFIRNAIRVEYPFALKIAMLYWNIVVLKQYFLRHVIGADLSAAHSCCVAPILPHPKDAQWVIVVHWCHCHVQPVWDNLCLCDLMLKFPLLNVVSSKT